MSVIIMSDTVSDIRRKLRSEHSKTLASHSVSTGKESSRLKRKKTTVKRNKTGNLGGNSGVGEDNSTVVVHEDDSEEEETVNGTMGDHGLEAVQENECLDWSTTGKDGRPNNEEDDEEDDLELEAEVFGNESTVLANFFAHEAERQQTTIPIHGDSILYEPPEDKAEKKVADAWVDDGEDDLQVDFSEKNTKRLRKLRRTQEEKVLTGRDLQMRLRDRFVNSHVHQDWAHSRKEGGYRDIGGEYGGDDTVDKLLSSAEPLVLSQGRSRKTALLQPRRLDIRRLRDANQRDPCQSVVNSVSFHPSGELLLTGGLDKALRIFRIDGEDNPKAHGVHFSDMPIHHARFVGPGGGEVICAGTKPYFYSYDVESGYVEKISRLFSAGHGNRRPDQKRGAERGPMYKVFSCSPCGTWLAFACRSGHVILAYRKTKQWAAEFKSNCPPTAIAFSSDSQRLFISGGDARVVVFDIRTRRCLSNFTNEGGTPTCTMALNPVLLSSDMLAIGSDSGVVNLYDDPAATTNSSSLPRQPPTLRKAIMNLVTPVSGCVFAPDGQILALASCKQKDALKMVTIGQQSAYFASPPPLTLTSSSPSKVHVETGTVFANWPTQRTPTRYPYSLDMSARGGYLAVGNDRGRVLLYQFLHSA